LFIQSEILGVGQNLTCGPCFTVSTGKESRSVSEQPRDTVVGAGVDSKDEETSWWSAQPEGCKESGSVRATLLTEGDNST
jgi:hypothetical protein